MVHAEVIPKEYLRKPEAKLFYLRMHGIQKNSSSTTKLRIIFYASTRTSNGNSLNDTLLPGPMHLSCNLISLASLQEPFGSEHSKNVLRDQPQPL